MRPSTDSLDDRVEAAFASLCDPWPVWHDLREAGPVIESSSMFLVTRHAEVKAVFRDTENFSSEQRRRGSRTIAHRAALTPERRDAFDEISAFHALMMQTKDDPSHDRLRKIAHRAFTPRRIAELGAAAKVYVTQEIDELVQQGTGDLGQLAKTVPLRIMADLLGVPDEDCGLIKDWSNDWFEYQFVTDDRIYISRDAQREFRQYVDDLIEAKQGNPEPSHLESALIGAHHDERLVQEEVAAMYFQLLFAGHETTANLIGTGVFELLSRPDQWHALTSDPEALVPRAIEELLRYVAPVQFIYRFTLHDTEIADVRIPAGATATVILASANRDPLVFDAPDTLDIMRPDVSNHLTFGFGPHFCLGSALARLESAVAIGELARRLPGLELATDAVRWRGGSQLRGLVDLPVHVGRA